MQKIYIFLCVLHYDFENIGRYIDDYVFSVWTELINGPMVVGLQLATKKSQRIKIFRSEWSVNVTTCWPQKSMWQRRIERYRVLSIILFQSQRVRQWVLNWTFQSMLNQLKLLIIHWLNLYRLKILHTLYGALTT